MRKASKMTNKITDAVTTHSKKAIVTKLGEKTRRLAKKRAPKACQCCRARKVRCNVTESGTPCMNCRLDEVDCVLVESKRKRRCTTRLAEDLVKAPKSTKYEQVELGQSSTPESSVDLPITPTCGFNAIEVGKHIPHTIYQTVTSRLFPQYPSTQQWQRPSQCTEPESTAWSANDAGILPQFSTAPTCISHPWLKRPSSRIGQDEQYYLHRKSALSLPASPLRAELLRAYLHHVHPFMPFLDTEAFVCAIESADGSRGKVSLLLYHAVLFAASAHVHEESFLQAGYTSRGEARNSFLIKTKALYDMEYEADRLVQIQALLLLSSWLDSPHEKKDALYWLGVAINIAYAIGIDQAPERLSIDPQQQRRCKRLWWCLVIQEFEMALDLRRLPRIRIEDCEVPLLDMSDFEDIMSGSRDDSLESPIFEYNVSKDRQGLISMICVQRARLCLCIGRTLTLQLSPKRNDHHSADSNDTSNTNPSMHYLERISACRTRLHEWYDGLPSALRLENLSPAYSNPQDFEQHNPVLLQSLWIHMIHFATLSMLHTPRLSNGSVLPAVSSKWHDIFLQVIQLSSVKLADVASTLLQIDMVSHLPPTAVSMVYRAAVTQINALRTSHGDLDRGIQTHNYSRRRSTHLQSSVHCLSTLYKLQKIYPSAQRCLELIETTLRRNASAVVVATQQGHDSHEVGNGNANSPSSIASLISEAVRLNLITPVPQVSQLVTPPPESDGSFNPQGMTFHADEDRGDIDGNGHMKLDAEVEADLDLDIELNTDTYTDLTPSDSSYTSTTFTPATNHEPSTTHPHFLHEISEQDRTIDQTFTSFVNVDDMFGDFADIEVDGRGAEVESAGCIDFNSGFELGVGV